MSNLKHSLSIARVEKDVENAYREAIHKGRPDAQVTSPHGTDGYATWSNVRLLLEAKYDLDFKARAPVCNTLGQCLLYLKKFEQSGEPVPNVILVGDKNECFVLATSAVKGFLDLPLDWSVAPSTGNPELTRALVEGMNILPYVYDVDGHFKFRNVLDKIESLAEGEQRAVRANLTNIEAIFTYWRDRVFRAGKITPVEQVDVFLKCLFQPTDVYLHPGKKGLLVVPGYPDGVLVNGDQYRSFFNHFEQGYRPSEIERFYAAKDRLVEDDARRRQGAFFTPDLWVAEAHKTLDGVLGSGWRDECIVWDPAAGTSNLTRDYIFKDLIVSTAENPDVQVIKDQGYNPGASVFQYDFLNPDESSPFFEGLGDTNEIPDAVHERLKAAAKAGKRLVFLMNPPYAEDGVAGAKGKTRAGVASESVVASMCRKEKFGRVSRQLYAQFMYQASVLAQRYGFKSHTVALFSKPTFMSSGSYRKFRSWWYGRYETQAAFMFQASHFADVSGRWGISFTVWNSPGKTNPNGRISCGLLDVSKGAFKVEKIGSKNLYNSDGQEASKWVNGRNPGSKIDTPKMSSGLKVRDNLKVYEAGSAPGTLGVLCSKGNNVMESGTGSFMQSCKPTDKGRRHFDLAPMPGGNWRRVIALFAARKLVAGDWINDKDEYLAPHDEGTTAYKQWVDDCHIYAILHSSNNCTAMRNVPYKGKKWTIHNHFFWRDQANALAFFDMAEARGLYRDCKNHPSKDVFGNPVRSTPDPYMAFALRYQVDMSPEARDVLFKLTDLCIHSLPAREAYAAAHPELHLMAWDAGVYQLKHLWRDLFPTDWKELQEALRSLADKLRPGVYEHGFLLR